MSAGGRPKKYRQEYARQAAKLCEMGATDIDLADFFGVSVRTIYRWRNEFEEFCHALKVGKEAPDDIVERSLYQRAVGYSHPEIDIRVVNNEIVKTEILKHYPPDTKAALAWLYNRRPKDWHPSPDANSGADEALLEALKRIVKELPC